MTESHHPRHGEMAGRVRAAIAYIGLGEDWVAEQLDPPKRSVLPRMKAGKFSEVTGHRDYLRQLANLCGWPEWFMLEGFSGQPSAEPLSEARLAQLERALDETRREIGAVPLYGARPPRTEP